MAKMPRYTKGKKKRSYNKKEMKNKIVKTVEKVISRRIETKINDVEQLTQNVYAVIDQAQVVSLIPSIISHGSNQGQRVGNRINCTRLMLRFNLHAAALGAGFGPQIFDIFIFKTKMRVPMPPTSAEMASFLEDGSTSTAYTGDALDGLRSLNSAMFTKCYRKRIRLYNPVQNQAFYGATSQYNSSVGYSINLTKWIKDTWIYSDSQNTPYNDNLYIAIGSCQADNITFPSPSTITGAYSFLVEASYKDA
jgi:hypothetical protein